MGQTTTKAIAKVVKPSIEVSDTMPPNLPQDIFRVKINTQAIFDSIMSERASLRQGTHKVKTRAEVRGGGKKPFAQKGTGRARQGSIRAPQWVGGGVVWGPTPNKNYTLKVNRKVKRIALNSALTLKAQAQAILIHDFKMMQVCSTKEFLKQLEGLKLKKEFKKILIITSDRMIAKSAANLLKIYVTNLSNVTIETIVNVDVIIFSKEAMKKLRGQK